VGLITLGDLQLTHSTLTRPKPLALLSYVALEGKKPRNQLSELFWGHATNAATSLRVALQQLRPTDSLLEDNKTVGCAVPCDAVTLRDLLDSGQDEAAINAYTGAFLAGYTPDTPELEEWVLAYRELLATRVAEAHLRQAETALEQRDLSKAGLLAARAYRVDGCPPLEPDVLLRLLRVLELSQHDLSATVRTEAEEYGLRIPDFGTLSKSVLPQPLTAFVARVEQQELEGLLGQNRLVTVLGYGGAGKSRLALELAKTLEAQFEAGVFYVPLEATENPAQIPNAVLRVLGVSDGTLDVERLKIHLGQKRILLLLDNFEHLLEFGQNLNELLRDCPNLVVLVTSRERLNILGEYIFMLDGFRTLEPALELFYSTSARSGAKLPGSELPEQIVQLLERFPLAIELAASLTAALPLEEILEALQQHLDTLALERQTGRHNGMRAVFDWSWSLLSRQQQNALARLAVFVDGFSRAAGLELVNSNLATLVALVNKSLVQSVGSGRYRLHPLVGQYSLEKLLEQPKEEENAKAAHAEIYLRWLEENSQKYSETRDSEILAAFDVDFYNFQQAWYWLCKYPNAVRFVRLDNLVLLLEGNNRYSQGIEMYKTALKSLDPAFQLGNTSDFANVLLLSNINAAWLTHRLGNTYQALAFAESAQKWETESANPLLKIKLWNVLGAVSPDWNKSCQFYEMSANLSAQQGLFVRQAMALQNLAAIYSFKGGYKKAKEVYKKVKKIYLRLKDLYHVVSLNFNLLDLGVHSDVVPHQEIENLFLQNKNLIEKIEVQFYVQLNKVYSYIFYLKKKDFLKAREIRSSIVGEDFESKWLEAFFFIADANFFLLQNELELAQEKLQESLQLIRKHQIAELVDNVVWGWLNIQLASQQPNQATKAANFLVHGHQTKHWIRVGLNRLLKENLIPLEQTSVVENKPWELVRDLLLEADHLDQLQGF
jgi:predicted ATPase